DPGNMCLHSAAAFGVADSGSGRVLITGIGREGADCGAPARFAVARFAAAGSADPTGGATAPEPGIVLLPSPPTVRGSDIAAQADGKVLVTGHGFYNLPNTRNALATARLTAGGELDASFAAD